MTPGSVRAPSPEELAALRLHPIRDLARVAGVSRPTARSAAAGLPVRGFCLHALLDAARRLVELAGPAAPRPSCAPVACVQCPGAVFRRKLCRTCYRKLHDAGLAMPPPGRTGVAARTHAKLVRAWVQSLPPEQRAALRDALREVA